MRQIVAGNWKMHGLTAEAMVLADGLCAHAGNLARDLVVFPPFTQLTAVALRIADRPIGVGGQDCHANRLGAHTGDISAQMLRDVGATHVILGHSERRADHGETSELVRQKVEAALAAGLIPVVCVGETEAQRAQATETVGWQISGSLPDNFAGILAYEPTWAVGSGRTPTAGEIADMHGFIRGELTRQFPLTGAAMPILYGGSVKPANAAALLAIPDVNGVLVGGASLNAEDFIAIARAT